MTVSGRLRLSLTSAGGIRVKGFVYGVYTTGENTAGKMTPRDHEHCPAAKTCAQEIFAASGPYMALTI